MLSDAVSYPKSGDGWRSVVIGGLLSAFSVLLIPGFIIGGYYVRVFQGAALDEDDAPRFDDWWKLFVDGFKAFVIYLVYAIVPMVIMLTLLFSVVFSSSGDGNSGVLLLVAVVALVGSGCLLVMVYLIPAAITNFALTDRLGAAFELRTIAKAAFTSEYVVATILAMALRFAVVIALYVVFFIIGFVVQIVFVSAMIGVGGSGGGDSVMTLGMLVMIFFVIFVFFVFFMLFSIVMFYVDVVSVNLLGQSCGPILAEASTLSDGSDSDKPDS